MKNIVAIAGSNSRNSINKLFISYVANKINSGVVSIFDLNDFVLPLYSPDLQADFGIPEPALRFNDLVQSADGIILSLPEHNGSYSAAFKNLLDWNSRIDMKFWAGKPILLMAASPGARGAINVLQTAAGHIPMFGGKIISTFSLPSFYEKFKENELVDEELNDVLLKSILLFEKEI